MALVMADGAGESWLSELVGHWQVAIGLRSTGRAADVAATLRPLVKQPPLAGSPVEALLLRGYLLELAAAMRTMAGRAPLRLQPFMTTLASRLERARQLDSDLVDRIRTVLLQIDGPPSSVTAELAHRARAYVDQQRPRRVARAELTQALHTNIRYLDRAFQVEFGLSVAQYQRRQRTEAAIGALESAVPVKRAAREAGCGEATLRRLVRRTTGVSPRQLSRRG